MENKINRFYIDGEIVYFKKDFLGWHVVHPWKNEDGTINWFNLLTGGSWLHLLIMVGLVILICLAILEYTSNINVLLNCFDNQTALEVCKQSFGYEDLIINP